MNNNWRRFGMRTRYLAASVKNQVLRFEKAELLSERSEFNSAETKTANFWQRSRPCRDFSLILDFAHARQIKNEFSFALAHSQNWFVSFGRQKK